MYVEKKNAPPREGRGVLGYYREERYGGCRLLEPFPL
jgi:hypothetical protein